MKKTKKMSKKKREEAEVIFSLDTNDLNGSVSLRFELVLNKR